MPPHNNKTPRPDDCPFQGECIFEQQKDIWLDSRFLKTSGVIIGLLSPLFVWIVVSIFTLQSDMNIQKEKVGSILEIRQDIKSMAKDLETIKIDIATLKAQKGTP
jgi:hypothetical protein